MRLCCFLCAVSMFAWLTLPICGGEKTNEAIEQPSYADAAGKCERAIESRTQALISEYSKDVFSLKERFQRDGDLEKALAADEEWSRSLEQKTVAGKEPVVRPPELRALQRDYLGRLDDVPRAVAADILGSLRREASLLARAGDLVQGRVLDAEIKAIERLYFGNAGDARDSHQDSELDAVVACDTLIKQRRIDLQSQYIKALEDLERSFQSQGMLEDLFATKAERSRYLESPEGFSGHVVESPLAVRELQEKFIDLHNSLVERTANEVLESLAQQKKSLTIAGRLEDAIRKKGQEEAVRARYFTMPEQPKGRRVVLLKPKDWELLPAGNPCRGAWVFTDKEIRGASTSMVTGPIEDWTVITCKRAFRDYVVRCRVRMEKGNPADAACCLAFGRGKDWCMKPQLNSWSMLELVVRGNSARFSVDGRLVQDDTVDYDTSQVQIKVHTASVTIRDFRIEVIDD